MGASLRQFELDGSESQRGSDNVANSAAYEATGSTSLIRTASRRRSLHAADGAAYELHDMRAHLSKRHALDFDVAESILHAPVPAAVAPTLADAIVGLDAPHEPMRTSTKALNAYLAAKPEQAERELRQMLVAPSSMVHVSHVMRQRLLNAIGQQNAAVYQVGGSLAIVGRRASLNNKHARAR